MSELKLKPHQWSHLIQNRRHPVYGAALKYACKQAGIVPPEKKSGATSTPAAGQTELKKRITLLQAKLLGARLFTGGSGEQIRALADELESLKTQIATV